MMTSFAFILGVLPLVIAHGAGAEMRRALGTAVFSGMLGVTFFGIFLTPIFFYVIDAMSEWHVFSTGIVPRVGHVMIDTLQFGFLRRGLKHTYQYFSASKAVRPRSIQPTIATEESDSDTIPAIVGAGSDDETNG